MNRPIPPSYMAIGSIVLESFCLQNRIELTAAQELQLVSEFFRALDRHGLEVGPKRISA